jgi:hypothetical protein
VVVPQPAVVREPGRTSVTMSLFPKPVEVAAYTSAVFPRVKVSTPSRPSPLKSLCSRLAENRLQHRRGSSDVDGGVNGDHSDRHVGEEDE